MEKLAIEWPQVFVDPDFNYGSDMKSRVLACSNGLTGWFMFNINQEKPKYFKAGMDKIKERLLIDPVNMKLLNWSWTTGIDSVDIDEIRALRGLDSYMFDYVKAAHLIKEYAHDKTVKAGLNGDFNNTSRIVYGGGKICQSSFVYTVSLWGVPTLAFDNWMVECYNIRSGPEGKDWEGFWPPETMEILT